MSEKSEKPKRSGLQILDEIIPPGSSIKDFKDIYNQLDYKGTLADIIFETKKLSPDPLKSDRIKGEITGLVSEQDQCLTIGAKKGGELTIGIVQGYFEEGGIEGVAALVRESGEAKPKMLMVFMGSEADEYSFRFGYM